MSENNPFNPPAAQVSDYHGHTSSNGELVLEGISQPGGAGIEWIKGGWALFKKAPGLWIALTVILVIITLVLSVIPIVSLALNLLLPVFMGGLMLGCKALDEGDELTVGHLFAGFSNNFGNLVLVGLLYMAGIVVLILAVGVVAAIAGISGFLSGGAVSALMVLPLILIGLLCLVPLVMALWFAPPLVIIHNVQPWQAMKASFFACLKNWVPFLVYGLALIPLSILAMLPLFLGFLVLSPVIYGSIYASYKSMFVR